MIPLLLRVQVTSFRDSTLT